MFKLKTIINKRVETIRGYKKGPNDTLITPAFILFDDRKTVIELKEQDYRSFHDAHLLARLIEIHENEVMWEYIASSDQYGNATMDI